MVSEVLEKILAILEKIGHINNNQGLPIPNSTKKAYCGVALDCTAKYLAGDPNTYAKYLEAVDRIWRGHIQDMKKSKASDLVCEQLRNR
ncbi:Glutamate receptor, ionotropic kainate 1 [Gossypium australe]|uniref:Glutamate receptor, ionotropic kainate 1 n=1 Tax=Gossypium australe TaxID=47621 RepID=A0A5B6UL17_9ROSI|nr:Glutamate receptor, ionotropic kainate 1 [Gossypium australe]